MLFPCDENRAMSVSQKANEKEMNTNHKEKQYLFSCCAFSFGAFARIFQVHFLCWIAYFSQKILQEKFPTKSSGYKAQFQICLKNKTLITYFPPKKMCKNYLIEFVISSSQLGI